MLMTVTELAEQLKEPPHRVAYIIAKHRIKAKHRVGIIRMFGDGEIKAIKQGLYGLQVRGGK